MDREAKQQEIEELRSRVQNLESELAQDALKKNWPPQEEFYLAYHATTGFILGMIGALASLLYNMIGSALFLGPEAGESLWVRSLYIIRVYLTFPLEDAVLKTPETPHEMHLLNIALIVGVCLYTFTGMILGIPFQLILKRWFNHSSFGVRFAVATGISLALWIINFYGILSWLQPAIFGDNWIVRLIPWWVGATTHLVFGWTMLLVEPLGNFVPYKHPAEAQ